MHRAWARPAQRGGQTFGLPARSHEAQFALPASLCHAAGSDWRQNPPSYQLCRQPARRPAPVLSWRRRLSRVAALAGQSQRLGAQWTDQQAITAVLRRMLPGRAQASYNGAAGQRRSAAAAKLMQAQSRCPRNSAAFQEDQTCFIVWDCWGAADPAQGCASQSPGCGAIQRRCAVIQCCSRSPDAGLTAPPAACRLPPPPPPPPPPLCTAGASSGKHQQMSAPLAMNACAFYGNLSFTQQQHIPPACHCCPDGRLAARMASVLGETTEK